MKIESGALPATTDRLNPLSEVNSHDATVRPGPAGAGDAVRVSGEAHLMAEAASRVGEVGQDQVRPDVVERAKAALARGDVGADVDRLANRIIDGLLDQ